DRAHDIVFDGLHLEYSDFTPWYRSGWADGGTSGETHEYPAYDRQINMPQHRTGMILLSYTEEISLLNLHIENSGYSGIFMLFDNEDNTIYGNLIENTGYCGIYLEGNYPGEGDTLTGNLLS